MKAENYLLEILYFVVSSFYQPRAIILSIIVSFYKLFQNPKPAPALKLIDTRGFANYLSTLLHNLVYTFWGICMNGECNETYLVKPQPCRHSLEAKSRLRSWG